MAAVCFILFGAPFPWWRFKHRLVRQCNPTELQQWATNMLRQHEADGYVDRSGTNLPAGMADVLSFPPAVLVAPHGDHVTFSWGRGNPSIDVGSSAYVDTRPSEAWVPGLYLIMPGE
jgi:hypothetical protein